ncbi:hypothetical protein TRFO_37567 [Tritrichomonas foetus]|uniref:Initiator binding protein 39kDa C-terminal domain-containing protein n=1 Tax=Tritrichomonas foetus TaxID=1144522 RepID=A0A1J4JGD7_9EUKA|nr:hypothetical protein TRFO_37567 [Tritrichomonas foetus]|eukprot:OHS96268.1 hypothetical protein TRFO_37567 [Tritrichomonas foetus]
MQTDSLILNFRRSGFKITSKTNDWSPVGIPPNVQLGFMADGSQNSPKVPKIEAPPSRHETKVVRAVLKTGIQTEISFIPHLRSKWKIICDNYNSEFLPIEIFLTRLADMYQVKDLSQADSYYLLSLVTFCTIPGWVNFNDFVMLFSNFGEKNAVIPKLVLLLNSNKKCGNFLRFEFYTGQKPDEKTNVYFSNGPSYGFIVLWPDGGTLEITNDFNTPFFSEFLVDSGGNRYQSWDLIVNSS